MPSSPVSLGRDELTKGVVMTFHCNRLGNLFVKRVIMWLAFLYIIFFALPIAIWLLAEGLNTLKEWWVYPILLIIPTIIALIILLQHPQEFTFENKQLIWIEQLPTKRTNRESIKTVVTVADLHQIEFLQTSLEHRLNIGRIRFRGDIRSAEAKEPVERPIIPFYYGGIRKFDNFKKTLTEQLPPSAFAS